MPRIAMSVCPVSMRPVEARERARSAHRARINRPWQLEVARRSLQGTGASAETRPQTKDTRQRPLAQRASLGSEKTAGATTAPLANSVSPTALIQ